ncbi:MAG TPA: NAD(P)/FAD-dependent oxidoreductase [Terriglobales bacterium]|nr:NAD(P)/FAD-dependent oxidoreductase [Terriglobales bacterium]
MRIGIIGAGLAGLSAAYDLNRAGHTTTIFEAAPTAGGLAAGFKAPHWDWTLEKFYHHWFQSDAAMLGLIDELGWKDQVLFPRPVTAIYYGGKFHPFDDMYSNMPRFLMQHFSISEVVRFGAVGAYLKFVADWKTLEKYTAAEWMQKYCGPQIYDTLWRPMLIGKFGEENYRTVNMAWLWARLKSRTTKLGTFVGGFQAFIDKFTEVVRQGGSTVHLGRPVTALHKNADGTLTLASEAGAEAFDAVLSTSSPALTAKLAPDLPDSYAGKLRAMKSMGAVVLVITLKHKLTDYYWHNLPKEAGFPYLAMVEHTNFLSSEHYGGDHILYCGDYLEADHENFHLSKEQVLERFLPSLSRFNPSFDRSWVKDAWLWKTAYAQPVPPVNHSHNIPALRTPVPGLYFASMSQVYPWDRGTNYAVEIGRRVAQMMIEDLRNR